MFDLQLGVGLVHMSKACGYDACKRGGRPDNDVGMSYGSPLQLHCGFLI